jgi:hypothetical protein
LAERHADDQRQHDPDADHERRTYRNQIPLYREGGQETP